LYVPPFGSASGDPEAQDLTVYDDGQLIFVNAVFGFLGSLG